MLNFAVVVLALIGATIFFSSAPAMAQATRTWVSGVGDDANPCSRTAPCKTFAGAIAKTATAGEINCLDPGGFGAVTITKSITLDCHEVYGSVLVSGTNGIVISGTGIVVTIRNLNFDGVGNTGLAGISIQNASAVYIEDVMVMNFSQQGILDNRTSAGAKLSIRNATVRNNSGTGIGTFGGAGSQAVLENVLVVGNGFGVAAHSGSNLILSRSVVSESSNDGVVAGSGSQIFADNSEITHNAGSGVNSSGGGNIVLANSDIAFNGTAITGTTSSYGNNRIFGNTSAGIVPTALGGITNDHGQQ